MGIFIDGETGWTSIPNIIFRCRLPHSTVHLLGNLLSHQQGFHASYRLISEQTGIAPATIRKALVQLEALGLVTVRKLDSEAGRFAGNEYVFHADAVRDLTPELVEEVLTGEPSTASKIEAGDEGTASKIEVVTASKNEVAPLQKLKHKEKQLKQHRKQQLVERDKRAPTRATHLPDDWVPDAATIQQMRDECPNTDLGYEHKKFVDYWTSVGGAKGRKRNWDATWRNWIRRASENATNSTARFASHGTNTPRVGTTADEWLATLSEPPSDVIDGEVWDDTGASS